MSEYIAAQWGWDEDYQFRMHQQRFETKPFFAVLKEGEAIGTLSWVVGDDYAQFGEFYILKQFRGAGLGTRILAHALTHADRIGCPVRLEYLKWNPVGSLYRRHGFTDVYATETHFHLERPALVP